MSNIETSDHGSTKAVLSALVANGLIAILKFIVAFITGSATMKAEAIHSSADCINQILLLIGMKRSLKEPDELHTFGYGKEIHFYSLIVAIILFSLGGLFSVYEGFHKIIHPEPVENIGWIIALLIAAFGLEYRSFRIVVKELKEDHKGTLKKIIEKATKPSLIVVAVEDASALVGLGVALMFTVLALVVNPIFDGIGSVFIGLILCYMSFFLTNEIRKLIIGENIDRETRTSIRKIIREFNMVKHINNIRGEWKGEDNFLLLISIDIEDDMRSGDIEHIVSDIKQAIKEEHPEAEPIYIECINQRDSGD